jgi:hypothetical protein
MTIAAEKKKAMPLMFTSEVELVDRWPKTWLPDDDDDDDDDDVHSESGYDSSCDLTHVLAK